MKLLLENKRCILLISLTIFIVFCAHISSYADENSAPVFVDGNSATRSVAENTPAGTNIGAPVAATDADGDTLTYSKGWVEGAGFSIDSTTGQLRTKAPLDYETKNKYSLAVFANDGNGGRIAIPVTINITDVDETPVNNAPIFTDGDSTTRSIAENTVAGVNIGTAVAATDADNDTLTYSLGGTDAAAFRINGTTGHLQTKAALDYETKTSYSVSVSVSDGSLSDSIPVTISVSNVNEAPNFTDGDSTTRSVAENTAAGESIGTAVAATDVDANTTLTYTLSGTDAAAFSINSTTGQLQTSTALDYETKTSYSVTITVSDGSLSDSIPVTISVSNVNEAPEFTDGDSATRSVAENTAAGESIGTAVAATDVDANTTLTYSLGGTDASSFSIVSTSGQLQTNAALDYETKSSYAVRVSVSDGKGGSDSIPVTITVTDVNENRAPVFTDGSSTTRAVAENTPAGVKIGAPVAATDADGDTLTYSKGWVEGAGFSIDSATGQLRTKAPLDYETKNEYSFAVFANDGKGGRVVIPVTVTVTDVDETPVNNAPIFTDGDSTTRSIAENTAAGQSIGSAVAATDVDNDTLTYSLGGTNASSFSIVSTTGQLQTNAALDYETKSSYAVNVSVSDGKGGSDSITVTISVSNVNEAPNFTDGDSTTRSVAENTAAGESIGSAISATDVDANTTLTYSLGGTDASSFSIVSTTGQLQTSAVLDYETKSSYSVTVSASDGNGESDSISVSITVTDASEKPVFAPGGVTLTIAENTASGTNIGKPITATDPDSGDTLTYSLRRGDAESFSIDANTGQVRTKAPLDYETKNAYTDLAVRATDSTGLIGATRLTITVTDVDENRAPEFSRPYRGDRTSRSVAENTAPGENIGEPFTATDADNDTLTYTLVGPDASSFSIVSPSGQLQTKVALDYETKTSYVVVVIVSDGNGGRDSITVTINVTDVDENRAPVFADGDSTTRSIAENTASGQNIGAAVAATDADNDTLTYSLGGTDASSFSIVSTSGQLQINAALDYETKNSYAVTVSVSDGNGGTDSITVTINVTDVNEYPPVFTDGNSATRTVAENTAANTNIGSAVAATDADTGDRLTYTLGGTNAAAFSIVSTTGQLRTRAALNYETKSSYSVTVSVSDGNGESNSIPVTITVTDVSEKPSFGPDRIRRTVSENAAPGTKVGDPITAIDPDTGDTLTYSLRQGWWQGEAEAFRIDANTGQVYTKVALDYETQQAYDDLVVRATDSTGLSGAAGVIIRVTEDNNSAPVFTDGISTTRSVAENTAAGENIGSAVAATDADNDTLTYSLSGTDAESFSIVSTTGQLQTNADLDYETKTSYVVSVSVSDGNGGSDSIPVTISVSNVNEAPSFATNSATRSVAENTASGVNIGSAFAATDVDANTTLTYSLGGTDVAAFSIVSTSGQLQTKAALDYETKSSYAVTVSVSDGNGGSDSITVTITVTDVGEKPVFAPGGVTLTVSENAASGTNIGDPITATDPDSGDTLTYALRRSDAESFSIDPNTGQLRTKAALDYETKNAYTDLAVRATDSTGLTGATRVTINVIDVNEAPVFTNGSSTTRSIAENTAAGVNIGSAIAATDADNDTLTYSLDGTDAAAFSIISTSGQLQTNADLDYETQSSYSVTVSVSDGSGASDSITVTINVTDVGENLPVFTDGSSTTRSVAENTASGQSIGNAVAATDADNDTLTYSLSGTDAAAFSIVSTTGQLQTNADLDYETKSSYSVTISVSDGNGGRDSIDVTINVTDVGETPPVFTDGSSTTRSVAENTAAGVNIGTAISATDAENDTLTYSLGGTDAAAFSIVSTTGQLQTNADLDYETKFSYAVTVSVSDGNGGRDTIDVTINVTDMNELPEFLDGDSTTRSVAENTPAGINIGAPVAATDQDGSPTTYSFDSLSPNPDHDAFRVNYKTGQIQTKAALDYETKNAYQLTLLGRSNSRGITQYVDISVTINVTDENEVAGNNAPVFTDGESTTFTVAEDNLIGTNIGTAIAATDADNDTLTYSLGGRDPAPFSIVSTTGQIQNHAALDYETKTSYSVKVAVSDGKGGSATIDVTINVTDVDESNNDPPMFINGSRTIRAVAENTASGQNIGTAVAATDADNDSLTYSLGGTDASSFSIVRTTGQLQTSAALDYETKTSYAVTVSVSDGNGGADSIDVRITVTGINEAPVFTDGDSTTRIIRENVGSGNLIGTRVAATDPENDTLTYTLGGTDAATFNITSGTGQLYTTKAALDHETKISYSVTITASDGKGGSATIDVTINVTDVYEVPGNNAPVFTDGESTTLSVAEDTLTGINIGTPVAATDPENDVLTYTLGGTDAAAFSIGSTTGQLQTNAALDYETKTSYSVTITASDGNLTDSIDVTINVTDVNEVLGNNAPVFTDGDNTTRSGAEYTFTSTNVGTPVAATDADNDVLTYTLGGTDAAAFSIDSTTGQLQTRAALDYETKYVCSVIVAVSDGKGGSDTIDVTINVTDVNEAPVFTEGDSTTRSVAENILTSTNIGTLVAATDPENDVLTYTLGGTDAAAFSINSTTGQLQTHAALNYETKNAYAVTVSISDGNGGTDSIDVTIAVTDVPEAPVFTEGDSTTRSVAEGTPAGINIGAPFAATVEFDLFSYPNLIGDYRGLIYELSGTDASWFSIDSTSGQLQSRWGGFDYEAKTSYSVTITVVEDAAYLTDTIDVTINVTDVDEVLSNNAPVFTEGYNTRRSGAEYTFTSTNVGTPVAATDADNDVLTYSLGGTDAAAFSIDSTTGQLQTRAALDYETNYGQYTCSVKVAVSDGKGGSATIDVKINVTDVNEAPVFTEGDSTTRSVAENTPAGINIGTTVGATDPDYHTLIYNPGGYDTLTYSLGGTDAAAFSIGSTTGQLQTNAALDYETKTSYSVTITASDGYLTDSINVTINVTDVNENEVPGNNAPFFLEGASTSRSVAENTPPGKYIIRRLLPSGADFPAIDADKDTLTYSLGGTDAAMFRIDSKYGYLLTSAALDYETKSSYSVTVYVSDGNGGSDSIDVTIHVTNFNEVPVFTEGLSKVLFIAENTPSGVNIGTPFTAIDPENDRVIHALLRRYYSAFSINSTTGQIQTSAALDYELQSFHSLTVTASDSRRGLINRIEITVIITDVNEAPVFWLDSQTRTVVENTPAGINIGPPVWATDPENDTLTYTLGGTDAAAFSIVSTTGQLQTNADLDHETKTSYSVTITVSDGNLTDSSDVTINVTGENEVAGNNAPVFTDGESTTFSVAEDALIGTNIGTAVAATEADGDTLTYSFGGTDAASFSIDSTTGQIQTNAALDYETKTSYSVKVAVSDSKGGTDSIDITINVTDVDAPNNDPPTFIDGISTTRTVAENTASGENIGTVVAATDSDRDTLTYTLDDGTDAASFSIVSTTGQIQTNAALDYETKSSYTVAVSVSDGNGRTDTIDVTINVTDVDENAPVAPSVETSPVMPANTALLTNFPNPFNPETWIPYQLAKPAEVTLTLYDIRGVVVRRLKLGYQAAGFYQSRSRAIHWDGRNNIGEKVASGVYFYTLTAGEFTATRKLLIRK